MENNSDATEKSKWFVYYQKYMLVMGILGQFLFYMQGIKIFINQSARDVSVIGFIIGCIAVSSWLVYGILLKDKALIWANAFAVGGAFLVIAGILIHG